MTMTMWVFSSGWVFSGLLLLALLGSNLFWMRQVQNLVNKLMSRNYHEYIAANAPQIARESGMSSLAKGDTGSAPGGVPESLGALDEFTL